MLPVTVRPHGQTKKHLSQKVMIRSVRFHLVLINLPLLLRYPMSFFMILHLISNPLLPRSLQEGFQKRKKMRLFPETAHQSRQVFWMIQEERRSVLQQRRRRMLRPMSLLICTIHLKSHTEKKATFLMNDATVKCIRKLKDSTGNYLWQPSISGSTPDKIFDCNLVTSVSMPNLGASAKGIAFGDFSYYWIADRQNRIFKKLSELYAANGQVGFIGTQRVDGKLILPEAVKLIKMKASA